MAGFTIGVLDPGGGPARKLTKVLTYADGGFAVAVPYHRARHGYLYKMPVDYSRSGPFFMKWSDLTAEFTATDRAKLSIHADGFVQFSSERQGSIRSGKDPETGEPRGLGYQGIPLSTPIFTGPTFNVAAWGLEDFDTIPEEPLTVMSDERTVVFDAGDFYYRGHAETCNGYLIEGCVFPRSLVSRVEPRPGKPRFQYFHEYAPGGPRVLNYTPLIWDNPLIFIGLLCSALKFTFEGPSGWNVGGPSDAAKEHVLMAIYPAPADEERMSAMESLDYQPHREDVRSDEAATLEEPRPDPEGSPDTGSEHQ